MEKIINSVGTLLEGPVWHEQRKSLMFADIVNGTIFEYEPKSRTQKSWKLGTYIGCILLNDSDEDVLVVVDYYLIKLNLTTDETSKLFNLPLKDKVRFNDGKCDSNGNILIGTMASNFDVDWGKDLGELYRVTPKGKHEILESNMAIPNGLAWSVDCKYFYHIDSIAKSVFAYNYDAETSEISNRKKAVDFSNEEGSPDGMAIDSDGNLWVAMWAGHKVIQVNPSTGEKLKELIIPVKNVTSCSFGGENLDELYITTALEDGEGGNVYVYKTNVKGQPMFKFKMK